MSIGGWAQGGASGFGPSRMFDSLPYLGWRAVSTWVEEFVDAVGLRFDNLNTRFLSATARANLLDPTVTPSDVPSQYLATAVSPATLSASSDTMLDIQLYIALGLYPVDSNVSTSQKQQLVQIGWDALLRKCSRLQMLNLASKITDGVAYGWTVPPNNFSIILSDGAPSPGQGSWSPPASTAGSLRPWIFDAVRNTVIQPAFANIGVGYSQFRAGYSAAGEPVMASGARLNILAHEHFDTWAAGAPTSWTKTGTGTLTQNTTDTSINFEFTSNAAVLDLTAIGNGGFVKLSQAAQAINNQLTHRFQLDYKYTNTQSVSVLCVIITDANADGNTYYWNSVSQAWSTTSYANVVPVSSTRANYAIDIVPQTQGTGTAFGTSTITVAVQATSDGTATTETTYTIYRVGLYEKFDVDVESDAGGERTLWLPLIDAQGWATVARGASGASAVVPTNAQKSHYKIVADTGSEFAYHPALSSSGFRAHSQWVNLVKGSNSFTGADWTITNGTRTANAQISPIVGETVASATQLSATSTGAFISQATGVTPTSKVYVGGVWVKKLSADSAFTDVTISCVSTSTKSTAYTVTLAAGWQLLPFTATFGAGDIAALTFKIAWGAASSSGQIAVANAYLYDVTSTPGVLYPPVCVSGIGATGTLKATTCTALTSGSNVLSATTQRALLSVVRGSLNVTVVPTFDAASQPNGVIFDTAQGAAQNRVVLRISSSAIELRRWDNTGNVWVATLTLSAALSPVSGSTTWLRGTAILIRCIWDENSTMISVGGQNASGTKPGTWAPVDGATAIGIGNDYASANPFDGIVTAFSIVQLGAATS